MNETNAAARSFAFWRNRWIAEGRPRTGYTWHQLLSAQSAMTVRS